MHVLRSMGYAAVLLFASLLAACATADVSGHRVSTVASAVRLSSVDVIFLDRPSLKRTDLGSVFANPNSYSGLTDRVTLDVRRAMAEARDGVQAAFAARNVPGLAYLASDTRGLPKPTSHRVFVSLISAQATAQNTGTILLKVTVVETATNQLLWQGESKTFPGGDGFSQKAREDAILKKQQNFGDGIIRALREAGLIDAAQGSAS